MASEHSDLRWRLMEAGDLASINAMAEVIHPDFPEDDSVFRERMRLYGNGCFVLESRGGALHGYAVTHPWQIYAMPALNSLLVELPTQPSTYYLHDIALMPTARGSGAAARIVAVLAEQARREDLANMSLVSVNNSVGFWEKQGFKTENLPELEEKLKTYSEDARFMVRQLR
ncbi:Ribosomal protein S18 acetylase RimI [Phyllobacterium sp. YR620]|uniref:GNAT family N-acetyltransferase n=1 Tax=Phyllobacterium sp. YR620 TaxID=1881066 RepID=UPI0008829519|nr:GNAT family N-acetyltransferase [Phyllobacterium sp. YR620]SDP45365.1 Ribosomal protein S18 acetylase RimI [Phyllobacterium sp. YR620]